MLIHNADITGSLLVNGTGYNTGSFSGSFTGAVAGTTATASYVEYNNVANKPALVSSSAQISGFGIFATTGSNQFNGNQAITGSLTTTGTIVAQTLNVQQVTSSIVYSSGSNIFGNSVSNTQQFTGSLQVSGSSHYLLGSVGVGTASPEALLHINAANAGGQGGYIYIDNPATSTLNSSVGIRFSTSTGGSFAGVYTGNIANVVTNASDGASALTFGTWDGSTAAERMRITSGGNIEIGTTGFSSPSGADRFIGVYGAQDSSLILQDAVQLWELYVNDDFYINRGSTNVLTALRSNGNVGIGTTSPLGPLEVRAANRAVSSDGILQVNTTNSQAIDLGGSLSFGGMWQNSGTIPTEWAGISGRKENGTNGNYAGYLSLGTRPMGGVITERMRITSGGNVGIGTGFTPSYPLHVYVSVADWGAVVQNLNASSYGMYVRGGAIDGSTSAFYVANTASTMLLDIKGSGATTFSGALTMSAYSFASSAIQFTRAASNLIQPASGNGILVFASGNAQMRMDTANQINFDMNNGGTPHTVLTLRQNGNAVSINSPDNNLMLELKYQNVASGYLGAIGSALYAYSVNGGYVLLNASSAWVNASDVKRKRNFEPYTKGLSAILGLQPKLYNMDFQKDGDAKQVGLVAQEVKDFIPLAYEENDKFIGLNYNAIAVTMVKAIQELKSELDAAKAEIQLLKQQ